jgi:hypothetical protein
VAIEACPASTILPVFEHITAPKALHVYPDLTHTLCTDSMPMLCTGCAAISGHSALHHIRSW